MRHVILRLGDDGYWVCKRPSLPGYIISQGKTKEEAISKIKEAIEGYIESLKEDNLPIPEDRSETQVVII
jgi:predicted RNase H-like HicB family nuclease